MNVAQANNARVLIRRMPVGAPTIDDFELDVKPASTAPGPGEILVRTRWLSLDPYVRALMSGRHFLRMPQPGEVMPAAAVAEVLASRNDRFSVGDRVVLQTGLQSYAISDAAAAWKLHPEHVPESTALGILGMPGMTAYFGLKETAQLRAGETVLVSAASGPVGSMVGQIAQQWGARAIGIAGSDEKCDWVRKQARFDACINYRKQDVGARLKELAPNGVDVFFDNTGGALQHLVVTGRHLAMKGRVILCGLIDQYSMKDAPPGPNLGALMACRGRIEPTIVYDYEHRREEFMREVLPWHTAGRLAFEEDVAVGIESAASQYCRLLRGENFGKTLVRLPW
jgi:NADPH-dependent curcumin reductase CurA